MILGKAKSALSPPNTPLGKTKELRFLSDPFRLRFTDRRHRDRPGICSGTAMVLLKHTEPIVGKTRKQSTICQTRDVILDERAVSANIEGHACLFSHGRCKSVFRTPGEVKQLIVACDLCFLPSLPCITNIVNKENANIDVFSDAITWRNIKFCTVKIVVIVQPSSSR